MTSFIAACGSGRSTSVIPAVPAAWSVTTIAFIIIFSSVICLFGGNVAGSVDAPAIHKMSAIVELLSPCLRSALSALTGVPTKPDGTGSFRSLVLANRCVAPDHKTVPRLPILAVPSRDGCPPRPTRSCQKDSAGCPDLFGDPRGHRERTARLGRAVALLAGSGRSTRRLPRHRACGLRAPHRGAIRDWSRPGRNSCGRTADAEL